MHEKVFEADLNIQYTYAWDRLNEYRQVSLYQETVYSLNFLWDEFKQNPTLAIEL